MPLVWETKSREHRYRQFCTHWGRNDQSADDIFYP